MRTAVVMAAMALVMIGCNREPEVESSIDDFGVVSCPSADGISIEPRMNCEQHTCVWECVTYNGKQYQEVRHIYVVCGQNGEFDRETVKDATQCTSEDI